MDLVVVELFVEVVFIGRGGGVVDDLADFTLEHLLRKAA